ncbi:MAG: hypothetical protein PVG26_19625 [Desulfobacterales bacterium]|jgi:hypothetical protein
MKRSLIAVIMILVIICLLASPVLAKRVTLVGEVNDNYQIVADNQIYEVDNTVVGDDLVRNYMAFRVKVIGVLKEKNDLKIVTVESFEVIGE